MSPARSTVRLISGITDQFSTFSEISSGVKFFREISGNKVMFQDFDVFVGKIGIHNSTHHGFNLFNCHFLESGTVFGDPRGLSRIDFISYFFEF